MSFGKHVNCSFFNKYCNVVIGSEAVSAKRSSNFINEFCTGKEKTTCSSSRTSRGICQLFNLMGEVDDNAYKRSGWSDAGNEYADYCPIALKLITKNIVILEVVNSEKK